MKKKFLGIICLVYTIIICYLIVTNSLKNFLAPQMQIYIKVSVIPLVIMTLVLLLDENPHYKFKWTDIVLLLPVIMLILSNDGRLTESLSKNRMTNYKVKTEKQVTKQTEKKKETKEEQENTNTVSDDENPYFKINDENYQNLANYLTFAPKSDKFAGKTIRVRGFINKSEQYIPNGYFSIGKYAITCCAADASYIGFIVKDNNLKLKENSWYEIEGTLEKAKDVAGYDIMAINPLNLKQIDESKEEQYVYPCYNYDDKCKEVTKYGLDY